METGQTFKVKQETIWGSWHVNRKGCMFICRYATSGLHNSRPYCDAESQDVTTSCCFCLLLVLILNENSSLCPSMSLGGCGTEAFSVFSSSSLSTVSPSTLQLSGKLIKVWRREGQKKKRAISPGYHPIS